MELKTSGKACKITKRKDGIFTNIRWWTGDRQVAHHSHNSLQSLWKDIGF